MSHQDAKSPKDVPDESDERPRMKSFTRFANGHHRTEDSRPGSTAPSTLSPPPFETETEVVRLAWWLDAHMALASELLWLRQQQDARSDSSMAAVVRGFAEQAEAVRDALYELYCDAADPRVIACMDREPALGRYVRETYAWCTGVASELATATTALRASRFGDAATLTDRLRAACEAYVGAPVQLFRDGIRAMPVDFRSPVEPLRNLPGNLDQLVLVAHVLNESLERRFA